MVDGSQWYNLSLQSKNQTWSGVWFHFESDFFLLIRYGRCYPFKLDVFEFKLNCYLKIGKKQALILKLEFVITF